MGTIFTKIINKEIPADILYENENILAFRDINPQAPTHFLVIPKKEISTLNDIVESDKELIGELFIVAKDLAEKEGIDIRSYSIIYEAINEIKSAMEGMLEPTEEEKIMGNVEVRETYKISKIGTIAGCFVTNGNIIRKNKIRLIRDGIVIFTGKIKQLKRFKEDANEVKSGYECGISIEDFNDIKVGDIIESFEIQEIKRKL